MIDWILAYYYDKNCYNIHAIKFSNPQTFLILLDVKVTQSTIGLLSPPSLLKSYFNYARTIYVYYGY